VERLTTCVCGETSGIAHNSRGKQGAPVYILLGSSFRYLVYVLQLLRGKFPPTDRGELLLTQASTAGLSGLVGPKKEVSSHLLAKRHR